jgi:hypothetical protein
MIEAAHNPEVAGSNPAPATEKGPGNRVFLLERIVSVFYICKRSSATSPRAPASTPWRATTGPVYHTYSTT